MGRGRGFLLFRAALFVLLFPFVLGAPAWTCRARREVVRAPGLNVVLVTVDTLRADALGCYGRTGARTPRIDRLAATGARFTFAHAHNVVTLPSHANILSGRYPFEHGVRDNAGFRFPRSMETLATLLRGKGYRTGAFVSAFPLDSRFGLDRGFEVYDDRLGDVGAGSDFQVQERPASATIAAARAWIDATPGPRFAWIHLYEPHAPYTPPFDWRGRVETAYDGEVAAVDEALAPLLDPLLAAGEGDDTLVVFTSDHGEGRGDHGEATHGVFAYESTLHVPLVLHHPRLFPPRVEGASVRHVDLLPTILDALGTAIPAGLAGRSLLGLAQGLDSAGTPVSYFESLTPALTRGWAPIHGVIRDRLKLVELPIPELYDLGADPREDRNLVSQRTADAAGMRAALGGLRAAERAAPGRAESAEVRERLGSLGYVGRSGVKASYDERDDPKRNVEFEAGLERVIASYVERDLAKALTLGEELVRKHPRVPLGLRHLSFLRSRAGDVPGALEAGRRALAVDPGSVEAATELARLLNDADRPAETVALLRPLAANAEPDLEALLTYGVALAQTGQKDASIEALRRARSADPSNAVAAFDLGTVHALFGDRAEARKEFEAALALDSGLGRAAGSLGVLAAIDGRADEALRLWNQALASNPRDWDTLLNMGTLLSRRGRTEEARPYFERFVAGAPPARYAADLADVRTRLEATR